MKATAYHEAGHAVVDYLLGIGIQTISIEEDEESSGRVIPTGSESLAYNLNYGMMDGRLKRQIEHEIISKYAGMYAEKRMTGRFNHRGASADREQAADLGAKLFSGDVLDAYLKYLCLRAEAMISNSQTWSAIEKLASELQKRTTISGRQARAIIQKAFRAWRPAAKPEMRTSKRRIGNGR